MTDATLTVEIDDLAEGNDIEVKKAAGRDGRGELPESFFESYSAMANSDGGVILLGIEERDKGVFTATGIVDTGKVLSSLWDGVNNQQRVNVNLLTNQMVEIVPVDGVNVIRVRIPRARRSQRPVYVGSNPLTGSYRRNYEGDYHCDAETVRRMLAEQVEDIRDARLIEHYGMDDVDVGTLNAYRNQFKATRPTHPWLDLGDREFLRSIGGWTQDRAANVEGLTLAGLLMFGKLRSILDVVPYFVVDYQERSDSNFAIRWDDRVTTDGTWSGNLYDFYRQVIQKLSRDLKVPFRLKGAERIDDTPVHEALREALTNVLIHADYTGRAPITVLKGPGIFGFRNPGTMRLPLVDALDGGTSDCRNRNLQKMFQLAGVGEQAGSGIPKIYQSWHQQHWRAPSLFEETEPEQTCLIMRMASLLPSETVEQLDERFGPSFRELSEPQRLALATVAIEGRVTHARLRQMSDNHPHDLSRDLAALVRDGYLTSVGRSRGTSYCFPDASLEERRRLFQTELPFREARSRSEVVAADEPSTDGLEHTELASEHLTVSPEPLTVNPEHLAVNPERLATTLEPTVENPEHSPRTQEYLAALDQIAVEVRGTGKTSREIVERTILKLCRGHFLTTKELADLLRRSRDSLRLHYISSLLKRGRLELLYPDAPSHPKQAYRATGNADE